MGNCRAAGIGMVQDESARAPFGDAFGLASRDPGWTLTPSDRTQDHPPGGPPGKSSVHATDLSGLHGNRQEMREADSVHHHDKQLELARDPGGTWARSISL